MRYRIKELHGRFYPQWSPMWLIWKPLTYWSGYLDGGLRPHDCHNIQEAERVINNDKARRERAKVKPKYHKIGS